MATKAKLQNVWQPLDDSKTSMLFNIPLMPTSGALDFCRPRSWKLRLTPQNVCLGGRLQINDSAERDGKCLSRFIPKIMDPQGQIQLLRYIHDRLLKEVTSSPAPSLRCKGSSPYSLGLVILKKTMFFCTLHISVYFGSQVIKTS